MPPVSLQETFQAHEADIEQAKDALNRVIAGLKGTAPPEGLNARNLGGPYQACKSFASKLQALDGSLKEALRLTLELQFNTYWSGKLHKQYDLSDYEAKRAVVKETNDDLRDYGYVISHPETGRPCSLLATSSPDGKGRYVLSDQQTKKRTHTSMTLQDLLPLRLMPKPPRREGFIEVRNKMSDNKKDG